MPVVGTEITSCRILPSVQGAVPYCKIDGLVHFSVDPNVLANADIVDLGAAERNQSGQVTFSADFCVVEPQAPDNARGSVLFEAANRGRRLAHSQFNFSARNGSADQDDPGDAFLMRHGWTLAWCGWQWDVPNNDDLLGIAVPRTLDEAGRPISGTVTVRFQPTACIADKHLAHRGHQPYPCVNVDDPHATLTVREYPTADSVTVPRGNWGFGRVEDGRTDPTLPYVWMDGGFAAGKIYEVSYQTDLSPVVGVGLLAVRDFVSFLRAGSKEEGNPCAGAIERVIGYGISQGGRFLRHFLSLGLNRDEHGRQIFDGILLHVAGARLGQFNQRFAQPSDYTFPRPGEIISLADASQSRTTPTSAVGLLDRQREVGGVPKIIAINSSAEYWRGDGSFLHIDPEGTFDTKLPQEVRCYLMSGTQHTSGNGRFTDEPGEDGIRGANLLNGCNYQPLLRASLHNLDYWISHGTTPPPSVIPLIDDHTAVTAEEVLASISGIPGAILPDEERLPMVLAVESGPDPTDASIEASILPKEEIRSRVSAVDSDGNEVAGIRMPHISVPVATHTGWNPRAPEAGDSGQLCSMLGSTFPFPVSRAERKSLKDPRLSIEERYGDRARYIELVRMSADRLALHRYLLEEDIDLAVEIADHQFMTFTTRNSE